MGQPIPTIKEMKTVIQGLALLHELDIVVKTSRPFDKVASLISGPPFCVPWRLRPLQLCRSSQDLQEL
jgi:hypothetical protein